MRVNRAGFRDNLTAFNFLTVYAAQENADIVARNRAVKEFAEHFNARGNRLAGLVTKTDDFDRIVELEFAALNTTRCDRAATRNREDVFNRHKEGFILVAFGRRNVFVNSVKQLEDIGFLFRVAFKREQCRTCDNGDVVAGEFVLAQKFAAIRDRQPGQPC